jgi:hypothetical protein
MRMGSGIRLAVLLACAGCAAGSSTGPSSPSPSTPQSLSLLPGSYVLSLTRCALPTETGPDVQMSFVGGCGASANVWALVHTDVALSASNNTSCPPFVANGALAGALSGTTVDVSMLTYRDGTSHTNVQTLALSGRGTVDPTGFHGTFSGDYSSTPVFGGFQGPTSSCHGDAMRFQFTRLP